MGNKREKPSDNENLILFSEVDGICPICAKDLLYKKNGHKYKKYQVAHIYPLNATEEEKILLNGEEILSEGLNAIENLIALCPECHIEYDKPKTISEYRHLVSVKKNLLKNRNVRSAYHQYQIEQDILIVIKKLFEAEDGEISDIQLKYEALKIDEKTDDTITRLTKRRIKNDVTDYFLLIKKEFSNLDKIKPGIFELISTQVKSYYLKIKQTCSNQEDIYNNMAEWLSKKTLSSSIEACKVVVSFFVQNCEVFS